MKRRGEKNIEAASNLVETNHATSDECVLFPGEFKKEKEKKEGREN